MSRPDKKSWLDLVAKWESYDTQKHLVSITDGFNSESKLEPYYGHFISIIMSFAYTIYANAYSMDNITASLYYEKHRQLPHVSDATPDAVDEQRKLFDGILEKMPSGCSDYACSNGLLKIPDDTYLTARKAREIIVFLQSSEMDKIITENLYRNVF